MKSLASVYLVLCFVVLAARPAHAYSGNDLQRAITSNQGASVKAYVLGVLDGYLHGSLEIGVTASLEALERNEKLNGVALAQRGPSCFKFPGDKFNPDQVTDIVKKFLADNPQTRHKDASVLVLQAVSAAFPCK